MLKDYLKIRNEQEEFSFGINFGYVDRVAGMFDFEKNKPQNLTAYNLSLDIENADKIALQDLDKIINSTAFSIDILLCFKSKSMPAHNSLIFLRADFENNLTCVCVIFTAYSLTPNIFATSKFDKF